MKLKEILNEKNIDDKKIKSPNKNVRIIPTEDVMKKFEEIYIKYKKVFDYLKDK